MFGFMRAPQLPGCSQTDQRRSPTSGTVVAAINGLNALGAHRQATGGRSRWSRSSRPISMTLVARGARGSRSAEPRSRSTHARPLDDRRPPLTGINSSADGVLPPARDAPEPFDHRRELAEQPPRVEPGLSSPEWSAADDYIAARSGAPAPCRRTRSRRCGGRELDDPGNCGAVRSPSWSRSSIWRSPRASPVSSGSTRPARTRSSGPSATPIAGTGSRIGPTPGSASPAARRD